ncbi:hypothetical protein EN904_10610 [Mesorhizobium sp. M7A.F.Ca.CA.001.07.2.1]|uniref:hypothetical protein n=1 Tax=Mesorhizobium TaxID=68287 RepID=UPI000FCCD436|nr:MULTISPECIES: hypothetical protein [Mesorhizobium]RVB48713.1 hypothetical protein EN918_01325 [Mesorhizobium sp. M7A.F.Ca.CA.004.05.1.1]MCF6126085.1 hypothetical protein [Mesorhizobium ciceri]MCQ8813880.1 hypothetical protein [Mesorhizobium sp. SEMIA396]RUX79331.1 hypothetical protein EN983_12590 [Mesorhizobium sp. M7A.F.Ca.CA.004.08.2.1]RUX89408.1 hypothetical protein EN982_02385 [Mesorhizobium sp. M7A.F.Ca.CA.004.08.1.1]
MTKLSDLPRPTGRLKAVDRKPVTEGPEIEICPVCGQAIDMRDIGQLLWHVTEDHEPLELDS